MEYKYCIVVLSIIVISTSCNLERDRQVYSNGDLEYKKFYEIMTFDELKTSLYKDLDNAGPDADGRDTQKQWYKSRIDKLIEDCNKDWNKPERLFPLSEFTDVVYKKPYFNIFSTHLDREQINSLLELINDPTNFHWGETTFEPGNKLIFKMDDRTVAELLIAKDYGVLEHSIGGYALMKFGGLKTEAQRKLKRLCDEL